MYKRKATRPPRAVEQTEAMREREELKASIRALQEQVYELKKVNDTLSRKLLIRSLEIEKLLHDKVSLATELRNVRTAHRFIKGWSV